MDLEQLSKWAELINTIFSTIGIIAGGIWVYIKFIFHRTGKWNLKLDIKEETICYDNSNNCLLKIFITLRNEGEIKISPGSKGCRLTVRKVDRSLIKNNLVDYTSGELVIDDYDVLKKYFRPGIGYKMYEIEPKAEYHEMEAVAVSKGDLLSIRVEFFWKDDYDSITEYSIFYVE